MLELTFLNVVIILSIFVIGFIAGFQWNDKDLD